MESDNRIRIQNARVNNLKGVSIDLPRDKFIVVTGLSGSGKSSLAFDTLFAEGQRRYVESLSSYARQFLGRMKKPDCDFIEGLPPTIAIEQRSGNRNPRSTVGTATEIYEYLRLFFAKIGRTYSPVSGKEVKKQSAEDLLECMNGYPAGTRFTILAPFVPREGRTVRQELETLLKEGYTRLDIKGNTINVEELLADSARLAGLVRDKAHMMILIDRLSVNDNKQTVNRLMDSAETAFYEGDGTCMLRFYDTAETTLHTFSDKFEADGIKFEEPSDQLFSFNSPMGACPVCEGFGKVMGIDESLVIPNRSLSVYDGAVVCWRGEKMGEWLKYFIVEAERTGFPIFTPYYELTDRQKDMLWHGTGRGPDKDGWPEVCIDSFFEMLESNKYKIQNRVMLARYRGKTVCPECHGKRLRKEAGYVKICGKSITDLVDISIDKLKEYFDNIELTETEYATVSRLLVEINKRIGFMLDVGLEYLTLNRLCNTLSGGEIQRISLVASLGSSLVGSLYVLDEPSIGLHSRDTDRLVKVLRHLQEIGNTVVVVEHDEEIIREADYIVDVGPMAGRLGGNIVYAGDMSDLKRDTDSFTVRYLLHEEKIERRSVLRPWNSYIEIKGARQNNLKGIDVKFPLGVMTVVTGVSGSGKSTLVRDILYLGLKRNYSETAERPGEFQSLGGDLRMLHDAEFVDQNPLGRTSRSNPVTYVKAWDEIRKLFADQQSARQLGYRPTHFSFNSDGGRCEECKGDGYVMVQMQFMSDLQLECESCHGKRFKKDVLEVKYREKNIWDILEMTVNQAIEFFSETNGPTEQRVVKKLLPLQRVGLGYIKLGQSSSTLSGGESQRVKLAYYLGMESSDPTMFIFDEPTTGLHFHDIRMLLGAFDSLIERGHTVVVIEHNLDVIKCADYIIDLGPEGGDAGGNLVVCGTPEQVAQCPESHTGRFLKEKL